MEAEVFGSRRAVSTLPLKAADSRGVRPCCRHALGRSLQHAETLQVGGLQYEALVLRTTYSSHIEMSGTGECCNQRRERASGSQPLSLDCALRAKAVRGPDHPGPLHPLKPRSRGGAAPPRHRGTGHSGPSGKFSGKGFEEPRAIPGNAQGRLGILSDSARPQAQFCGSWG